MPGLLAAGLGLGLLLSGPFALAPTAYVVLDVAYSVRLKVIAILDVLVLALYVDSGMSHTLYGRPQVLWALCILLLYWISYLWLIAHRGRMHDDPLVFTVRDRVSRVLIALMALVYLIAL
jgi:4-hydroxybenzoate polyprenyltransferase